MVLTKPLSVVYNSLMGKEIVYPPHISKRMLQRNITKKDIEKVLSHPQITLPTEDPRKDRVMGRIDNKTLDIIYVETSRQIILVTAVWLGEEDRKVK